MTKIQLTLTGAQARAEVEGILTAGMVGVPVTITWDESWNGLVKTLVCRSDGCVRTILNVGSQATVAPEVFRTERWAPNALYLGVEGRDGEGKLVIPSTFAYCGQILPGAVAEGAVSQEPENPAWARILGLIGDMGALTTSRKESLVAAINEAAGQDASQEAAMGSGAVSVAASYQLSDSGTQVPTGSWSGTIPAMAGGQYLWTKITLSQAGGTSASIYTVSGGASGGVGGGVASVNQQLPDSGGNVTLTAAQIGAVPLTGGTMTGVLSLVTPTAAAHGATKGYVDTAAANATTNAKEYCERKKLKFWDATLLSSSFVSNSTYADYPYRAAVALTGVTSSMIPEVTFSVADLAGTEFAPVAECYNGGVYIYAADQPPATVIIPTIICWR